MPKFRKKPVVTVDFLELGAIAHYHDQPPFETAAREWSHAKQVHPDTTVSELIEWADKDGLANCCGIEITFRHAPGE